MTEPNGSVSFTVKELLAKIDTKIDGLILAVASKVDRDEFRELIGRVQKLELSQSNDTAVRVERKWLATLVIALVGALSAAGWLLMNYHH